MEFDAVVREIKLSYSDEDARRRFDEFTNSESPRSWYWRGELRYFLYEYEEHLASNKRASPRVTWADITSEKLQDTVEHVLPQSIEDRSYWQKRFDADAHEEYVHDIGNLSLTRHNSFYSNKPFPAKKGEIDANGPCYVKSPLFQEQELAQYDDWTAEAIDRRRFNLLKWAKDRWHVDFSGIEGPESDNDDDEEEGIDIGAE
jgi:hypothetical protein